MERKLRGNQSVVENDNVNAREVDEKERANIEALREKEHKDRRLHGRGKNVEGVGVNNASRIAESSLD